MQIVWFSMTSNNWPVKRRPMTTLAKLQFSFYINGKLYSLFKRSCHSPKFCFWKKQYCQCSKASHTSWKWFYVWQSSEPISSLPSPSAMRARVPINLTIKTEHEKYKSVKMISSNVRKLFFDNLWCQICIYSIYISLCINWELTEIGGNENFCFFKFFATRSSYLERINNWAFTSVESSIY